MREEAVKNLDKKKKSCSPKGVGKFLSKKKGKFYIIGKCISMLLCAHEEYRRKELPSGIWGGESIMEIIAWYQGGGFQAGGEFFL
ncbi:hypothetical protein Bca4012_073769 [Brassica carinata]